MKILILHTYYQQRGGEDSVFEKETKLLKKYNHHVDTLTFRNDCLSEYSNINKALISIWNKNSTDDLQQQIKNNKYDILHIHNTFPFTSPAVIHAAKKMDIPIVMTLHNYRLHCINAILFRKAHVCQDCIGMFPWKGLINKCYRDSYSASFTATSIQVIHKIMGTWDLVNRYIALTDFSYKKFIEGGIPAEKIAIKPNFTEAPTKTKLIQDPEEGYVLFVGRLSTEKGIETLLKAWDLLDTPLKLKIAGDGPLQTLVQQATSINHNIKYLGQLSAEMIQELMNKAICLVFPSEWYEGFPMVIVEALSSGLPILTSNIGSQATIVHNGITGLHFEAKSSVDLAEKLEWINKNPLKMKEMGKNAYINYKTHYTPEKNHQQLIDIYQDVIDDYQRRKYK